MKYFPKNKKDEGFIQLIILLIIALLVLHFLNISLKSLLSMQSVRDFFVYLWGLSKLIWQDFLLLLDFIKGIVATGK